MKGSQSFTDERCSSLRYDKSTCRLCHSSPLLSTLTQILFESIVISFLSHSYCAYWESTKTDINDGVLNSSMQTLPIEGNLKALTAFFFSIQAYTDFQMTS